MLRNVLSLLVFSLVGTVVLAGSWPRFRGDNGQGIANEQDIPVKFADNDGIAWKVPIIGTGHSGPVIWDDYLFLQTATPDGTQRLLLCLDARTGKERWSRSVTARKAHTHQKSSLASSTPAADSEAVYVSFWDGKEVSLAAYNFKGDLLWNKNLGPFVSQHGAGASPIVYKDKVLLANDMDREDGAKKPVAKPSTLLAFDKKTGEILWEVPRQAFRTCYSAPYILERGGSPELMITSTTAITSYNPDTGAENWHWNWTFPKAPLRTIASSFVLNDMMYAFSGDGGGDRQMYAVSLAGTGKNTTTKDLWDNKKDFPYVPNCLHRGSHLYFVNDRGFAGCFDARSGKKVWLERLPEATFSASPVLIDGKVYAPSEQGDVWVFAADSTFQLLGRNTLGEMLRASPAVADGRLFVRGQNHLFCISKKK